MSEAQIDIWMRDLPGFLEDLRGDDFVKLALPPNRSLRTLVIFHAWRRTKEALMRFAKTSPQAPSEVSLGVELSVMEPDLTKDSMTALKGGREELRLEMRLFFAYPSEATAEYVFRALNPERSDDIAGSAEQSPA